MGQGGDEGRNGGAFSWVRDVYENLDYYLGTDEGRRRLEDIARSEAQRLEEEIARVHRPQRDIIWMSKWCLHCAHMGERGGRYYCDFHGMRLVKPFYGKPLWAVVAESEGDAHYVLLGVDWDRRWRDVEDYIVNAAMESINGGRPYFCYEPAKH
ncbi:MAG: hypothetical protein RXP97_01920 [Nitrososphaeria archaeon]